MGFRVAEAVMRTFGNVRDVDEEMVAVGKAVKEDRERLKCKINSLLDEMLSRPLEDVCRIQEIKGK
ncbi:MAG: hypothetical protein KGZ63_10235 [Clostridiales bacterium]|nr:hypothetical protein [Clostridiales bacterium]